MPTTITAIGDSHTTYFAIRDSFVLQRLGLPADPAYIIDAKVVQGASLTGLRSYSSTLRMREVITEALPSASHMVLNLGQVDLELGFYYRQVIKQETWTPESYVAFLIDIYRTFLTDIDFGQTRIALKGVNLTALTTQRFMIRYLRRIITDSSLSNRSVEVDGAAAEKRLWAAALDEQGQNAMHLAFNAAVKRLAAEVGAEYFDINRYLAVKGRGAKPVRPMRLDPAFQPVKLDHHVLGSIEMYRQHYLAAGQVFGLKQAI